MKRKANLLVVAGVMFLAFLGVMVWSVNRLVAFARDLPNRIVIDEQLFADAMGEAVVQGLHSVLSGDDQAMQLSAQAQLQEWVDQDSSASAWVGDEYKSDLLDLSTSSDTEVAAAASKLLSVIQRDAGSDIEGQRN